uniref:Double-GTPase 2 domain-containing protein n=1 Tax=Candidatus Kentrum sp. DK TaxID=2126562 RepID=A0A450SCH3_9GAMM|nr:MAG: hypothetical protein BECKDK2373C_GA0170839_102722 [Candidatus Kentron sp. DK]
MNESNTAPDTTRTPDAPSQDGPSRTMDQDGLELATWGIAAAGKTVLMMQLYLATRGRESGPWSVIPDKETVPYMKKLRNTMEKERRFPSATLRESQVPIIYHFQNREDGRRARLQLVDRAGALWEDVDNDPELTGQLASAHGVALLVDPIENENNFHRLEDTLNALFHARGNEIGDSRPIALCLTKADTWIRSWEELVEARDDPDTYSRRWLENRDSHSRILNYLSDHCPNARLFPVSAIGIHARFCHIQPAAYFDDRLDSRILPGGEPLNILEPFLWLIEQAGAENE